MLATVQLLDSDLWSLPGGLTSSLIVTAWIYGRGYLKIRRTRPSLFPRWRLVCFLGGLFSLWIALASPLDTLNDRLLFMHMAQHMVLMLVVPPLLLLGYPTVPLLRGLPRSLVRRGLGPLFRSEALRKIMRFLTKPMVAWIAVNAAFVGWHLPGPYELALRVEDWHEVEHFTFLLTSLLFWFPIIQPWPSVSQASRWRLLPYLLTTDIVNTVLAAVLSFSNRLIYPSYAAKSWIYGISPVNDQAGAGALMWVIGSIFYLVPAVSITMRLLSPPERRLLYVNKST
jgi:putative membrane protein